MRFTETKLKGAYIIEIEPKEDERGFFARSFCRKEFKEHGLDFNVVQCNISYNKNKGALRGMHYQISPHEEAKLVSCTRGAIYDVIIDLRKDSPTYSKWFAIELSASLIATSACYSQFTAPYKMLYVPKGFAHGFQTLEDNTIVFYQMSEFYHQKSARGVKWDDPAFGIQWPLKVSIISECDENYSSYNTIF